MTAPPWGKNVQLLEYNVANDPTEIPNDGAKGKYPSCYTVLMGI